MVCLLFTFCWWRNGKLPTLRWFGLIIICIVLEQCQYFQAEWNFGFKIHNITYQSLINHDGCKNNQCILMHFHYSNLLNIFTFNPFNTIILEVWNCFGDNERMYISTNIIMPNPITHYSISAYFLSNESEVSGPYASTMEMTSILPGPRGHAP